MRTKKRKKRFTHSGKTMQPIQQEQQEVEMFVVPAERVSPKQDKQADYERLFIKESNITARLGKTVYVRKEFHERILKIIQVIGDNDISLFSYIDNVLIHHFDSFQNEIMKSYKNKNNDNLF